MKAAILTMFTGLSPTYSLVNVAADQIRMLLDAGIEVRMLVSETCPDRERTGIFLDPRVEWVRVVNTRQGSPITWYDYSGSIGRVHDSFFEEADLIARDLVRCLDGVDFCLMHDILYQGWHLVHNIAVRKVQEQLPGVRFVEFTHSLPLPRPEKMVYPLSARFTGMPNTRFACPTQCGLPALARQYDIPESACAVVNNTLPLLEWADPAVRTVACSMDLSEKEILIVCPGRLTPAKRFEKAAMLAGAIRTVSGKSTGLIFCDFPSADIPAPVYKSMIRTEGKKAGLADGDLLFTSDLGFPDGFPRQAVLELFGLSNLFLCPSFSESFGLTVLEAASRGNFLVLNEAVPALEELGKSLGASFLRWDAHNFGFDTQEHYSPSERAYYLEHGARIVRAMEENPVLRAKTAARTRYSTRRVAEHQLLPLLDSF